MPYQTTVAAVRQTLVDVFAEVDRWFDRPAALRAARPASEGWSMDQVLEHITLTSHFLLIIIRRWTDKALRKVGQGQPIPEGESDLALLESIGQRGSFTWVRPEHMEPTGIPSTQEVRALMQTQLQECLSLLASMARGEGSLCKVRMSVNGLGKIDLYQWLYFLAQHARRHLQQMQTIEDQAGSAIVGDFTAPSGPDVPGRPGPGQT